MSVDRSLDAMRRAEYLLNTVVRFIGSNRLEEYEVEYDETTCDGTCLSDDCKIARDDLHDAIRELEAA